MYVMLFLAAQTSQRYGISADLRELQATSTAVAVKTSLKIEFASFQILSCLFETFQLKSERFLLESNS